MDRIVVKVDDTVAKSWRDANEKAKEELENTINFLIKEALAKKEEDFWQFLDRVGEEAQENGLTEEILNKLLSED
jgi:hypothetical protein